MTGLERDEPRSTVAVLFDIDGTLISTGGAGAAAWRLAFDELYGVPADIGSFADAGMTDPEVGRRTFEAVLGREPSPREFGRLMQRRLHHLERTVAESHDYQVLDGVDGLLLWLAERGLLLGLVTGNVEAAAHLKLQRAGLNRFFSFGGYGSDSPDRVEVTKVALRRASVVYGHPLEARRCVAVGDTPHDVDAAHGAGVACVGVANHRFARDRLTAAGADWVVASLAEGLPSDALGSMPA